MSRLVHLNIVGSYKPGDQPPIGYTDWHEWANVQHKAGLRQSRCDQCRLCKFPQERHHQTETLVTNEHGLEVMLEGFICNKCFGEKVSE